MNIGIVTKVESDHLLVMNDSMKIEKIKSRSGVQVGERLEYRWKDVYMGMNGRKTKRLLLLASLIMVMMASFAVYGVRGVNENVSAVVSMDINPSIELWLDHDLNVLKVIKMNKDAETIVSRNLVDLSLDEVVDLIVLNAGQEGYLPDQGMILFGVHGNNEIKAVMEEEVDRLKSKYKHIYSVVAIERYEETELNVKKGKVSVGREMIAEELALDLDEVGEVSVPTLATELENAGSTGYHMVTRSMVQSQAKAVIKEENDESKETAQALPLEEVEVHEKEDKEIADKEESTSKKNNKTLDFISDVSGENQETGEEETGQVQERADDKTGEAQEAGAAKADEAKEEAVAKAEEAKEEAAAKVDEAQEAGAAKVDEAQEAAADKASEAQEAAAAKVDEAQEVAADKVDEAQEAASDKAEEAQEVAATKADEAQEAASDKASEAQSEKSDDTSNPGQDNNPSENNMTQVKDEKTQKNNTDDN